jgi:hypothetical protein
LNLGSKKPVPEICYGRRHAPADKYATIEATDCHAPAAKTAKVVLT